MVLVLKGKEGQKKKRRSKKSKAEAGPVRSLVTALCDDNPHHRKPVIDTTSNIDA